MQKTEFIDTVATKAGVTKKVAQQLVNAMFEVISESLQNGEKVTLTGFGSFDVRQRRARSGVNPQTREKITIAATKTPGFSASSNLKATIRGNGQ
jgi:DNA-binding protein HU-beta